MSLEAAEVRVDLKRILEDEYDDVNVHLQGKRIVVDHPDGRILVLVTDARETGDRS